MKNKYTIKSKKDINKWFELCNIFAKSLCDQKIILNQYNTLTADIRIKIKNQFKACDDIRRKKIPNTETEAWFTGVMVDANILATEYNIDPLTVMLCVSPICKPSERILIK